MESRSVTFAVTLLGVMCLWLTPVPVQAMAEELAPTDTKATTKATEPEVSKDADLGLVPRALFTLSISQREPGEEFTEISTAKRKVIFFTELGDLTGQRILHRWEHNGEIMAEVEFDVGGSPWRVYSIKTLRPDWVGEWTASVVDPQGRILSSRSFSYLEEETEDEGNHAGLE